MPWPEKPSNSHYLKLYAFQDEVLRFIQSTGLLFYLGGGTALSRFYYFHRYSDDLDFFSLPDTDFIASVEALQGELEANGYLVSIYGFSQKFSRFSITEPNRFPDFPLKVDFICPRPHSHAGDFMATPLFPRIDNPKNILAEKIIHIHKKSPKDIADIWVICQHLPFFWEDMMACATKKGIADPLFTAQMLGQFDPLELNKVLWISPIQIAYFERDREIIIKNIITKESNQLFSAKKR